MYRNIYMYIHIYINIYSIYIYTCQCTYFLYKAATTPQACITASGFKSSIPSIGSKFQNLWSTRESWKETSPSLPKTSSEGVLGMLLGSKYLLTRFWKSKVGVFVKKISVKKLKKNPPKLNGKNKILPKLGGKNRRCSTQLMTNWWFGSRWFGIPGVPLTSNPFHKGISRIQTTNPNFETKTRQPPTSMQQKISKLSPWRTWFFGNFN